MPVRAGAAMGRGARASWAQSKAERDLERAQRREPAFDVSSWSGALITMTAFAALLWIVEIVNSADDGHLTRFGIVPRTITGLRGVVLSPFLHEDYRHVLSNTLPVILIGWVVLLAGLRVWAAVTVSVIVLGGLLTWLVGPGHTVIVGASGLVFGWLGYLIARALFSRRFLWIVAAAVVVGFFGTLLDGLIPRADSTVSWQAHVCGFLAGLLVGWALHPRGRELRRFRRAGAAQ